MSDVCIYCYYSNNKTIIRKIRWVYNDWILIIWWISFLLMYLGNLIAFVASFWEDIDAVTVRVLSFWFSWSFLLVFQTMSMVYPILLIIYWHKLSLLNKGVIFYEVKKIINRIELFVIITAIIINIIFAWIQIIPNALIRAYSWVSKVEDKFEKVETNTCSTLFQICYYATYFDTFVLLWLIFFQTLIYFTLNRIMKRKLHFFYQIVRNDIRKLFIFNIIYLSITIIFWVILLARLKDNYNLYLNIDPFKGIFLTLHNASTWRVFRA